MPKRPSSPSSLPSKKPKSSRPKNSSAGEATDQVPGGGDRDAKGDEFWELSGKRRATISKFGGKVMVGIREYYEKDGEALPGKKGISLTLEQFNTLITLIPHIEAVLADKGESVVRPNYSGEQPALVNEPRGKEEDSGGGKKNFEATSEEE